ncbi:MAG TPA: hypothetical protein VK858_07720 [Longimicrobiales bacterium]|nr:hypothetical protein [Longimicrobiales bacterium]
MLRLPFPGRLTMRLRIRLRPVLYVVLLWTWAGAVAAQEPGGGPSRVTLEVRQVAGANVYLDLGTAGGLVTGDTIRVLRPDGSLLGRLAVEAATATRSVLTFADGPFPLATGETVVVELVGRRPPDVAPGRDAPVPAPPTSAPVAVPPVGSRVSGRVTLEAAVSHSVTELGVVDPVEVSRTFATPALRLDATVSDLVGGFTLRTRGRVSHRYTSGLELGRPTTVRVDDLALERRFTGVPLRLTLGRFFSPAESFSGYWDGVAARMGGTSFGGGLLLGFEPDRWSRAPSLDLPKATGFIDFRVGRGRSRWDGDVSVHFVAPRHEGWADHLFFGLGQRVTLGPLRLRAEVQADREPEAGSLRIGEAVAQASVAVSSGLALRAGAARRERYTLSGADDPFGPRRDRIGVGLTLRRGNVAVSGDHALNRYAGGRDRTTWSGSLSVRGVPGLTAGTWTVSGSWWSGAGDEAMTAGTSLAFRLSGIRTRVGYRYHASTFVGRTRASHAPELDLDLPLGVGVSLTLRTRGTFGSEVAGEYAYLGLSRAF